MPVAAAKRKRAEVPQYCGRIQSTKSSGFCSKKVRISSNKHHQRRLAVQRLRSPDGGRQSPQKLKHFLSKDRLEHSYRVADLAIKLAKIYNEDLYRAEVAGLLHDCAKELTVKDYKKYGICKNNIENFDLILRDAVGILHSFVSREFAKVEFGIDHISIKSHSRFNVFHVSNFTQATFHSQKISTIFELFIISIFSFSSILFELIGSALG